MHSVRPAPGVERLTAAVMTGTAIPEPVEVGDEITDASTEALGVAGVPAEIEGMARRIRCASPLIARDDVDAARGRWPGLVVVQARCEKVADSKRPSPAKRSA